MSALLLSSIVFYLCFVTWNTISSCLFYQNLQLISRHDDIITFNVVSGYIVLSSYYYIFSGPLFVSVFWYFLIFMPNYCAISKRLNFLFYSIVMPLISTIICMATYANEIQSYSVQVAYWKCWNLAIKREGLCVFLCTELFGLVFWYKNRQRISA